MRENEGYRKLVVWQNAYTLRKLIYQLTSAFPKSEIRRVAQMRDAARSVKQNIQEGYQRNSLGDYVRALEIAKASLSELRGDLEDSHDDELITKDVFVDADALCGRTDFLFARLLKSLYEKQRSATWRKKSYAAALL